MSGVDGNVPDATDLHGEALMAFFFFFFCFTFHSAEGFTLLSVVKKIGAKIDLFFREKGGFRSAGRLYQVAFAIPDQRGSV